MSQAPSSLNHGVLLPVTHLPQSSEGFYALNNPFQTNGPKWFCGKKWLGIEVPDMYLRLDLPGVGPDPDDVDVSVDDSKRVLIIKALAPIIGAMSQHK